MSKTIDDQGGQGLLDRLEHFRQADTERDSLLRNLVHGYKNLERRLQEQEDDLEDQKMSRRILQANVKETNKTISVLRAQTERDQFALVLIDGDGVIFQDVLLSRGADGGSEAAHRLHTELKDYLQDRYPSHNFSIMVNVVANFEGLSKKLASVGILKSPNDLHTFARAFSCSQPLFSFLDVGMGKERADHKLKEMFRIFLNNMQCRHIIFGGCHDYGYLPHLEPLKRDEQVSKRISLLESTSALVAFHKLGFDMCRFSSVFRDEPLPESRIIPERHPMDGGTELRPRASNFTPIQTPASGNVFSRPQSSTPEHERKNAHTGISPSPRPAAALPKISPNATPSAAVTTPASAAGPPSRADPTTSSSYAAAGAGGPPTKAINVASSKPVPPRKAILLNVDQHRIDMQLPKPEETAARAVAARIKKQKLCNTYHLSNKCMNGTDCDYSHHPPLSQAERMALRAKARELPCYKYGACRDVDCTSGHHCPRGELCEYPYCKFNDDLHSVDLAVKLKQYEDGDVDVVR